MFRVGPVAFEVGTVAFFGGHAAPASGGVALAQLLDAILPERAIDAGGRVGILCQRVSQRAERGLEVLVVGVPADAKAWRDLGTFPSLEEGFVDDLTLHPRQVVQMQAKDLSELVDVVFRAPLRGRRRVVLAMVIPREDPVELTVGDFAPADDWLRRQAPMGMDRAFGALALADAVYGVVPHDGEESPAEVVCRRRDPGRLHRPLQ